MTSPFARVEVNDGRAERARRQSRALATQYEL